MNNKTNRSSGYSLNNPTINRPRSSFDLSHRVLTTLPVGKLAPIDIVEVLPGDTWKCSTDFFARLISTFIRPIMDDMYLDTFSFFVPLRLTQNNLENVFGDSSPTAYDDPDLASLAVGMFSPGNSGSYTIPKGSVGDYLGLPTDKPLYEPQLLAPFRAFALIWNEFFRVQSVDQEVLVNLSETPSAFENFDSSAAGSVLNRSWGASFYLGGLPPVRRYRDYFSTALPAPQKGPAVVIPGTGNLPVVTSNVENASSHSLEWRIADSSLEVPPGGHLYSVGLNSQPSGTVSGDITDSNGSSVLFSPSAQTEQIGIYPSNLVTAATDEASINALRLAFQLQKYLERDAIYGSRYREYLYAAYGVNSPDARMQVPELLATSHNRLNVQQVASTASPAAVGTDDYDVGQVAAMSVSADTKRARFTKSFTEHGYIITCACIRYRHVYSQGINRLWTRRNREDFYDPLFANLGMQAIKKKEIYAFDANGTSSGSDILGYQEAWAEYRTIPDRVSAYMRPGAGDAGKFYSLSDRFLEPPSLLDIIHEDGDPFERVISGHGTEDPFIVDFRQNAYVTRVVYRHSMPGYADHH